VLHNYLSVITDSKARYLVERELRFRRWWDNKDVDIEQLKLSVPIESIIESYGVGIPQGRLNIACPLPEHKDGTPSFSINKSRNLFKCFWCGKWWSQIDFIKEMEKCDTQTAINKFLTFV
jgi:DNA primase